MSCKGLHCPGCGDGEGGAVLGGLLVIAFIAGVIAYYWQAICHALHVLLDVLLITGISAAGITVVTVTGVFIYRRRSAVRAAQPRQALPVQPHPQVASRRAAPVVARRVRTLDATRRAEAAYTVTIKQGAPK